MEKLAIDGGKPVREKYLVFGRPEIKQEEIDEVVDSLKSGWIGTGPKVARFEQAFREYVGCKHAKAVNSCTAGMHLSLLVAGVKQGDELITTPMTFCSTGNVVLHSGATPKFVDCERETGNISPEEIEKSISPKTKAIIPVHLAGRPCKMDEISRVAEENGLVVLEDAAHAIGAKYRGKAIGTISPLTAFSFYVTKNLVCGEGGMVTTDNGEWAERIEKYALHGLSSGAWKRYSDDGFKHYEVVFPGYKYNMMDLQAALGIHQLERVEENLGKRERIWKKYDQAFSRLPLELPPLVEENTRHARHLYAPLLKLEELDKGRDFVQQALHRENIGSGIHFMSLHLHRYYKERFGFRPGDFPNADFISGRTISLPLSPNLSEQDVEDVINAVVKVLENCRK
jgi:dTDP-4-amino-4,6-dideoxygalactose transaminase